MISSNDFNLISKNFQENIYTSDIENIRKEFGKFDDKKKKSVLNLCEKMLDQKSIALHKNEKIRVSVIKVITVAWPDSAKQFNKILSRTYTKDQYELLFTIFCFVDNLLNFPNSEELCNRILLFVREFLLNVKHKTGKAAWMAGDLLGAHWNLSNSLPILCEISQTGTYIVGREAAINGLTEAWKRTTTHNKKRIRDLLYEISKTDKSKKIRVMAQLFLKKMTLRTA